MNIVKNMEFIFLAALLVITGTSYAVAEPKSSRVAAKAGAADMHTVIVVGHRQKAKLAI